MAHIFRFRGRGGMGVSFKRLKLHSRFTLLCQLYPLLCVATLSCSNSTSSGRDSQLSGRLGSASVSSQLASNSETSKTNGSSDAPSTTGVPDTVNLVNAEFKLTAKTLGIQACSGRMNMKVNAAVTGTKTAQLFEVPAGGLDCGFLGKIDLAQILGAFSQPPPAGKETLVIAHNVVSVSTLGDGNYSPARPLLPSFIAVTAEEMAKLDYLQPNITLTTPSGSDHGSVRVKMNSYNQAFVSHETGVEFKNVMDFTITNSGFNKLDKVSNFIFDEIRFKMNANPVSILSISLKGSIKGVLVAGGSKAGNVTGLLGAGAQIAKQDRTGIVLGAANILPLTVEMILAEQEGLAAQIADAETLSAKTLVETQ
jgi:hypothetical protein